MLGARRCPTLSGGRPRAASAPSKGASIITASPSAAAGRRSTPCIRPATRRPSPASASSGPTLVGPSAGIDVGADDVRVAGAVRTDAVAGVTVDAGAVAVEGVEGDLDATRSRARRPVGSSSGEAGATGITTTSTRSCGSVSKGPAKGATSLEGASGEERERS